MVPGQFFLPAMFVAPFPTMVKVAGQENAMMINGSIFVHNVYAFFVIIALLSIYRKKIVTYHILILAYSGELPLYTCLKRFCPVRTFSCTCGPFLLILAGYGVTQLNNVTPHCIFLTWLSWQL